MPSRVGLARRIPPPRTQRRWDSAGRVPFAIVAVLVLLLSGASAVYLSAETRRIADDRATRLSLDRLNWVSESVCGELDAAAQAEAVRAIALSTQFYENASLIDGEFQRGISSYLGEAFPTTIGGCEISLESCNLWVTSSESECIDAVESSANASEEVVTGDEDSSITSEGPVIDNSAPDEVAETLLPAFYVVAGCANFTLVAENGMTMSRSVEITHEIQSPYPLLKTKLDTIEVGGDGEFSPVARIAKYVLTTVAQFRVLEGYGSGLRASPGATAEIIGRGDVELALNLAIVLEIARRLRAADPEALAALGDSGALGSLVTDYASNGTLDPADLVALYSGLDVRPVPVDAILAQGFNAVVDQFILKLFDYLGLMEAADACYGAISALADAIGGVADTLTGWLGDDEGEGLEGAEQASRWAASTVRLLGDYPPTEVDERLLPHGGDSRPYLLVCDALADINASSNHGMLRTALVDETTLSVTNATGTVIGTEHVLTIRSLDCDLATRTSAQRGGDYVVRFDESHVAGNGTSDLWREFYDSNFSDNVDLTYGSLRDSIKAICSYAADEVAGYFSGRDTSLAAFGGGAYAPDPRDNESFLDDLSGMLDEALGECFGHYSRNRGALKGLLMGVVHQQEGLKEDLARFVSLHYDELAGEDAAVAGASAALADALWSNATMWVNWTDSVATYTTYNSLGISQGYTTEPRPSYDYGTVPSDAALKAEMWNDDSDDVLAFSEPYAQSCYDLLSAEESSFVQPYSDANGYLVRALEASALGTGDFLVDTIVGAAYDWGFFPTAEAFVMRSIRGIVGAGEVSNVAFRPVAMLGAGFSLVSEGGAAAERSPAVRMEPAQIGARESAAEGCFAYNLSEPTGTHYTDLLKFNDRPYETVWSLTVDGSVEVAAVSDARDLFHNGSHVATAASAKMPLNFTISICAYSGWNLSGVAYVSSATLAGDLGRLKDMVKEFFEWALDAIMAPIKWLIDQAMKLVDILSNALNRLLSYAQRIIQAISDAVQVAVEMLQKFVRQVARDVLGSLVDWLLDWLPDGLSIDFEFYGFRFHASLDPDGAMDENSPAEDVVVLDITVSGDVFGAGLDMGLSVLRLGWAAKNQTGSEYDVLFELGVSVGDFAIDVSVDPLMAVNEYIAEGHGGAPGWKLDFALPVAERRYDTFGYSLQDIEGVGPLLQNIPIPFLGAKASVDAGFEVSYTEPGFLPDHVVVNEVEVNPRGSDNGTEWVELFNPFKHNVSANDWSLSTHTNGTLGNFTFVLGENATIPPRSFLNVRLPNESLDDGGCRLELSDASGALVDSTHWLREPPGEFICNETVPETGGASTWQRSPNAADANLSLDWTFRHGTANASNGAGNVTFKQLVMATLERSFRAAWDEAGEMQLSFDWFVGVARATVDKFLEDVLDLVEASVVEVEFYLDVRLTDATGSAGGGFRLSFVIEGGETARQLLEWIIGSVEAFAKNFMKPAAPAKYPKLAPEAPEHLFLRFEAYGMVSTPAMLGKVSAGGAPPPSQMRLAGRLEANVPALAALVGKEMGRWRVNFGLYLEDVPGSTLHDVLGTPEDESVDLWILKGSAYEV